MSPTASDAPIAIFVEDLGGGGAEKVSVTLANGLVARGFAVDLVMWRAEGPYLAAVAPAVRQINFSAEHSASAVDVIRALRRYFREQPPRIFLSQLEKPSLLAILAALMSGYRHVVPCVHIDLLRYMRHGHRLRRAVLIGLVMMLYRFVPSIVAVSNGAAMGVRRLLWPTCPPVSVVYNGFDLIVLRAEATLPVEEMWLRDKNLPVFIACGRLVPQKAYDVLLQAFALVRQRIPARLIILGEGPLRGILESQVEQLELAEFVRMPGFVAKPAAWVARSDVFVLSSRNEGLPNVLIEAMAVNTRIVSTDCPSGPREILADGRFGQLVAVGDGAALAQNMIAALQEPLTGGPQVGTEVERKVHLEKFSVTQMVENYLGIINVLS